MKRLSSAIILLVALTAIASIRAGWFDRRFATRGANGPVRQFIDFQDRLWIVGDFTSVNGIPSKNVAATDGTNWISIKIPGDPEIEDGTTIAGKLLLKAGSVYSDNTNTLLTFNGRAWGTINLPAPYTRVGAFTATTNELYAELGAWPDRRLARWTTNGWTLLAYTDSIGLTSVRQLAIAKGVVYATGDDSGGGRFGYGRVPPARLAGEHWETLPNPATPLATITDIASDGANLFVAGSFSDLSDTQIAPSLAFWNGASWSIPDPSQRDNYYVFALHSGDGSILLPESESQLFDFGFPPPRSRIVSYTANTRTVLAECDVPAWPKEKWNGKLFIGGWFEGVNSNRVGNIAQFDGNAWSQIGEGQFDSVNGSVNALAVCGTNLFAAGNFTWAGDTRANHIARWDGLTWNPLGPGINGSTYQLLARTNGLFAVGSFEIPGIATNLAYWDSQWHSFGPSTPGLPSVLAESQGNIYVAQTENSSPTNCNLTISRSDGSEWQTVATATSTSLNLRTMLVTNNVIYLGGQFENLNGMVVNNIAMWRDGDWHELNGGVTLQTDPVFNFFAWAEVDALAFVNGELIVGGAFLKAGDLPVNHIAAWNGSGWRNLGGGIETSFGASTFDDHSDFPVRTLTLLKGTLYAGGSHPALLSRLDGDRWTRVLDNTPFGTHVFALANYGTDLFVGSDLHFEPSFLTNGIALLHTDAALRFNPAGSQMTLSWPLQFRSSPLQMSQSIDGPWSEVPVREFITGDDRLTFTVETPQTNTFYRLGSPSQ